MKHPFTFNPETKEQVWQALLGTLTIQTRGKRIYALCPFHTETNPSLLIDKDGWRFRCFGAGCGARGTLWYLARYLKILPPVSVLDAFIKRAWEKQDYAAEQLFRLRGIPPEITKGYGGGYLEQNGINGISGFLFPHPDPTDYCGFILWRPQKGYINSRYLSKEYPFGWIKVQAQKPVWVTEGVFDALSVVSAGQAAVATLGHNSIVPSLQIFDGALVLAADRDASGYRLLWQWINEIKELSKEGTGFWDTIMVCRWSSKDPNEALKKGTLQQEMENKFWLPVYIILSIVLRYRDDWRSVLFPYLSAMPERVRQDAVKEATERLQKEGITVNIPTDVALPQGADVWIAILRAALLDKTHATWLFNQPYFSISLLPPTLHQVAYHAFRALEYNLPFPWQQSPYGLSAVKWAWHQWFRYRLENILQKLST